MNALSTWLAQLRQGELSGAVMRLAVQDAVAGGVLERATLRNWLDSPQVMADLPAELAVELKQLAVPEAEDAGGAPGPPPVEGDAAAQPTAPVPAETLPEVIAERYQLLDCLGEGGMGAVFKAIDLLAQEQEDPDPYVALKILRPDLQQDHLAVVALQREAHRAFNLAHPGIVRVRSFEQDRDSGLYFIVMELLEGSTVQALLREHPAGQPWSEVAPCLEQICAALEYAHRDGGLVHSDIKPSNLFITTRGQARVLDFGIAAPLPAAEGEDPGFDARTLGARTTEYASLDTFQGCKAHDSDDVYSLACVTYQWLSGVHPYASAVPVSAPAAAEAKLTPAPVRGLTRAQNRALRRALALPRSRRTQTIEEFWEDMSAPAPSWPRVVAWAAAGVLALAIGIGTVLLLPVGHKPAPAAGSSQAPPGHQVASVRPSPAAAPPSRSAVSSSPAAPADSPTAQPP